MGNTLRFPKLGNLRTVVHRPLEGTPKSCTIRRDGDQWFVSIVCEIELPHAPRRVEPVVAHVLHTLSTVYAKSHDTVVVERLRTTNMLQNHSLARRIADAGWGHLVELLRYKLPLTGGRLVEVPAAYSSQTCSACGAVDRASRHRERFRCTRCNYVDHADLNAAKVLKSRVNRSALPVEGAPPEGTHRSRKVVNLRVPRRSPQSPAL